MEDFPKNIKLTVERGTDKIVIDFSEDCDIYEWIRHFKVILKWVSFADETINEIFTEEENDGE